MVLIKKYKQGILILLISFLSIQTYAISASSLDKKLNKIIKKEFKLKGFEKSPILITNEQFEKAEVELLDNQLFKLSSENGYEGFYAIETAMGRFDDFVYVIFFEMDLTVKLVRVVEYGEEHGVEITHKQWLKQFIGKTPEDNLRFSKNIDAISGATISGKSITESINNMLQKVKKLRENNLL
jgi:Na+-translocating ferredoxin:NAD+ oxidoreductase RnfG subunit